MSSALVERMAGTRFSPDLVPKDVSFPQFLYNRSLKFEDRTAVIDDATGKRCSYKALWRMVWQLASGLRNKGLRKGDRVCLVAPNCFEYPSVALGICSLGGVLVPLNPSFTPGELGYFLEDSEPSFIICSSDVLDNVLEASKHYERTKEICVIGDPRSGYTGFEDLLRSGDDEKTNDPEQLWTDLNPVTDLLSLYYSSGTTGLSKGCMHTHYGYIAFIIQSTVSDCPIYNNDGSDCAIVTAPLYHMYGMVMHLAEGLARGCTLVITPRFQAEKYATLVEKYQATVAVLVPPALAAIADSDYVTGRHLRSVRRIVSSSSPLGVDTVRKIKHLIPNEAIILEQYGATEFSTSSSRTVSLQQFVHGCVGQRMAFVQIKIVDLVTGRSLGPNESGEIFVKSPAAMVGYWKNPDLSRTVFDNEGYIRSGDLGYYDDSESLYIADRLKDVMKYKGYQVNPSELESLLLTHPSIRAAAVVGKPHEHFGDLPTAFIVTSEDVKTADSATFERNITEFVAARISPWKKLRGGVRIVEGLPKSASGKVLKRELRRILEKDQEQERAFKKSNL